MPILDQREHRFVLIIAAFSAAAKLALAFRSDALLATRPYIEDSFYAFSCAFHLARGQGFTVDGIHPTNGIQPLICILYTPCFLVTDKWLALRLTFIFTSLFGAATIYLVAVLVRSLEQKPHIAYAKLTLPVIAAVIAAISMQFFLDMTNGLETGLATLLLLCAILNYRQIGGAGAGHFTSWLQFGLILGLAMLARIDAIFLVLSFAAYELYRNRSQSIIAASTFCIVAAIVSSPWWYYNYHAFGSFIPISGQSEALGNLMLRNIGSACVHLADIVSIFFYLPNYPIASAWSFTWCLAMGLCFVWWLRKSRVYVREHFDLTVLVPPMLFCGLLFCYYVFFFSAPHFLDRYFQPIRMLWIVLFAMSLPMLYSVWEDWKYQHKFTTLFFTSVLGIAVFLFSVERYATNFTTARISEFYLGGRFAEEHPQSKVGMDQSGTASFVSENVVNLDGKVNWSALRARKSGSMGEYLAQERFDFLIDWPEFVDPLVKNVAQKGLNYRLTDSIGSLRIYRLQVTK